MLVTSKRNALMKKEIEMLDALFRHATEGIVIIAKTGKIVMVNPTAENMFGYSKEDLIGKTIEILIPKRYETAHVKHRDGYMERPHPRSMGIGMDLYARRKDESEFPVEVSLSNFSTSEGEFIMSFIIDITERKKQEVIIRQANDQIKSLNTELELRVAERTEELAQAINKLAESKQEVMRALEKEKQLNELKSRFVTTASHEFRTPLATILSSASLVSRYNDVDDEEKRIKHINRIKSAVNNLTQILNDFLSLSKLEEGIIRNNPELIQLDIFSKEITEELRTMTKQNQRIIYSHVAGEAMVELDKQLFKNIVINLLSNAIKYSPQGRDINFTTTSNNKKITITIKDQGIGIPQEDQPHMFQRFFRAQNAGTIQGTGLGLNIVKRYVELMEGEISFMSKLNEGTTFNVEIPRNADVL